MSIDKTGNVYCDNEKLVIFGLEIEQDKSGVGHCWRPENDDCPADIIEEIATEIVDSGAECDNYRASNGRFYRWKYNF